jgi:transposase InsO family protein
MKKNLKGKKMWSYVDGTSVKPTDETDATKYAAALETWDVNNSKIITWINNSVSQLIGMQLAKYDTAKEVWDHLKRLLVQSNFAKRYQLESDIRALKQNNMTIQDFYSAMSNLWDQLALMESAELKTVKAYIDQREEQRLVQFLMALRDDFEGLRGSILHRTPLPKVDSVVNELLAEEIRLKYHSNSIFDKGTLSTPPSVFVAPVHKGKPQGRVGLGIDECAFCKEKGHWKTQCLKLLRANKKNFKSPSSNVATAARTTIASGSDHVYPYETTSQISDIAEQLQKILATQSHAMSASSVKGLNSSNMSGMSPSIWILDSGASHHMSYDNNSFVSLKPASSMSVMTADDTPMPLAGIGSVRTPNMSFSDVYYIPSLTLSLASVSQLCDSGYSVTFSSTSCCVQDPHSGRLIGTGRRQGGLYVLDELRVSDTAASTSTFTTDLLSSFRLNSSSSSFYLWHSRLGHVSASRLRYLVSTGALGKLQTSDISDCCGCKLANFSALPFSKSVSISFAPFDLVHSDVWGPSPVLTKGGSRYYVSFIDDYTRYCWVYLMKNRFEFFDIYLMFRAMVKTQHNVVIKCFRCDLGGEYTSNKFFELLAYDGTIHQTSCTDTPQQNGVAERKHRHIVETARSLLLSALVPNEFWGEAILTAVHAINRIPSLVTSGLSPFEKLYRSCPDYSSLKVFGSTCFVLRPHVERDKLSSRSALCVFLGYGDGQKGYRCYDPLSKKLYVSRHVVFLEHIPFFSLSSDSHAPSRSELTQIDPFGLDNNVSSDCNFENCRDGTTASPNIDIPLVPTATQQPPTTVDPPLIVEPPPPHYPSRDRKSTQLPDFVYSTYSASFASFLTSIHSLSEPSSYKEAILDPLWQQAMREELSALHKTDTWELVPLPLGKLLLDLVGCTKSKLSLMGQLSATKHVLLLRDFLKNMVSIMKKPLLR